MAGMFVIGESKTRPGVYYNIDKAEKSSIVGAVDGIVGVLFRSDFGPLGKLVELNREDGYEETFGTALTTDALKEAFEGGAKTILAYRLGSEGTCSEVTLKNDAEEDLVKIIVKYPGERQFSVSIKQKLSDENVKQCIIYSGLTQIEKFEFSAGEAEASALAEEIKKSKAFIAELVKDGTLAEVAQTEMAGGTNPTVTNQNYSDGLAAIETTYFNTICVDTEEDAVHLLVQAFLERVGEAGQMGLAVIAQKSSVDLEDKIEKGATYNDASLVYVVNAHVMADGAEMDGYQTAARIAGMIAAVPANESLTHTEMEGYTELLEPMTPTQMVKAEKKGGLVLSYNTDKKVWIDNAINTLVTPADNQDEGWKKIRRVKTRYELTYRMTRQAEQLVGKVDNDQNGRATLISQMNAIGTAMIDEGKLTSCNVTENSKYAADTDYGYFDVDVVDKDSLEHVYLLFRFRYSTEA